MVIGRVVRLIILGLILSGLSASPLAAQTQLAGAIAGAARDTSGAVLPGVTVEASSPALIEKVRSAVTDAQGLYQIADLRPGKYSVTFTLAGFRTLRRDGIELSAGFTANVNGDLEVGSLEETITVTGTVPSSTSVPPRETVRSRQRSSTTCPRERPSTTLPSSFRE